MNTPEGCGGEPGGVTSGSGRIGQRVRRCICSPFHDAAECVEERYGYSRREALQEPCECACHYEDEDEDA